MDEERKREQGIEMEMQRKRDQMKWLQHVGLLQCLVKYKSFVQYGKILNESSFA